MLNIKFEDLVEHIRNDEVQINALRELAKSRFKKDTRKITEDLLDLLVDMYIENGVHYIPPLENGIENHLAELEYICESMGIELKDYGITNENSYFFSGKFVIPVRSIENKIIFYVNHNFDDEKVQKYINTFTGMFGETDKIFKSYGMHNFDEFLKNDTIVVCEGIFDSMLLSYLGIPTLAILGTQVVKYHEMFVKRFKNKFYIGDNDKAGDEGWKKFKSVFKDSYKLKLPSIQYKDVEESYLLNSESISKIWIDDIKKTLKGKYKDEV